MSEYGYDYAPRQSTYVTGFNDFTSDATDQQMLESILDDIGRGTAEFGMVSNSSCDYSEHVRVKPDKDTSYGLGQDIPHNGESSTPLSNDSQAESRNFLLSPIDTAELFKSPPPNVETTEELPNINTSIKTLAAEIANLGSKVENLCSLVDHFEDNMEKVSNHIEALEDLLARVVKLEKRAMETLRDLS
ncbi:hypothetical protein N7467_012039 [Penicillium canescens]|nr:hypothetical protein N7467_012039 [Penicillium canescens]